MFKTTLTAIALATSAITPASAALQFSREPIVGDAPHVIVGLNGRIDAGDAERLGQFFKTMPQSDRVWVLKLTARAVMSTKL